MVKLDTLEVVVSHTLYTGYPQTPPFHPRQRYPEYAFQQLGEEENSTYDAVRECFHLGKLDVEHFNTPKWNPLQGLINSGSYNLLTLSN
jgi:hypothetical protein